MFENQKTKIMKQTNNTTPEVTNQRSKLIERRVYAAYSKPIGGFIQACAEANKYPEVSYEYCKGCNSVVPIIKGLHECLVCGQDTIFSPTTDLPTPNNTTQDRELFTGGDWEVHSTGSLPHKFEIHPSWDEEGEHPIADIHQMEGQTIQEAEANALLISESKNLFYALKELIEVATETTADLCGFDGADQLDTSIDKAKEILTRITNKK